MCLGRRRCRGSCWTLRAEPVVSTGLGQDVGLLPKVGFLSLAPHFSPSGFSLPGVSVKKGQDSVDIFAPVIISDAGIFNTYERLLPAAARALPGTASALGSQQGCGVNPILSCIRKQIYQLALAKPLSLLCHSPQNPALAAHFFTGVLLSLN